ncbi:MAG: ABC transporter substrate-binding protein [Lysobacterales bacterium]
MPLVAASPALAQGQRVARVAILATNLGGRRPYFEEMKDGLRERGWIEGKNIAYDVRSAEGNTDLFRKLAAEIVAIKPDVIFATTYLSVVAVTDETDTIPVVFAAIADPVKSGLVKSLARPGGQLTGVALQAVPLAGKRIEILRDALPQLSRIGVLYDSRQQGEAGLAELRDAVAHLRLELLAAGASNAREIELAFAELRARRAEALLVTTSIRFFVERRRIIELAARHKLPAIYEMIDMALEGGLIAYGPDYRAGYRRAAHHIDRILRGARPGDLPIEEALRYELVVNQRTARSIGVALSPLVLLRADRVIE